MPNLSARHAVTARITRHITPHLPLISRLARQGSGTIELRTERERITNNANATRTRKITARLTPFPSEPWTDSTMTRLEATHEIARPIYQQAGRRANVRHDGASAGMFRHGAHREGTGQGAFIQAKPE